MSNATGIAIYVIEIPNLKTLMMKEVFGKQEADVKKKWPEVERRKENDPRKNKFRRIDDSIKLIKGQKTVVVNAIL